MRWEKVVINVEGHAQKIYINEDNSHAVVFPPFGKYFGIRSDKAALDLAITLLFHTPSRDITYTQYLSSQEDTSVIFQEAA